MVKASSAAAMALTNTAMTATADAASTRPKTSASSGCSRPAGSGRFMVLAITRSMSRSYHMLMAPAAPAPKAMHSTAMTATSGEGSPGARIRPTMAVKTTSDMTRGLSNSA